MNWGAKIVLGLGVFMLFIVSAGIYMVTSDSDTLVDEDYYENSLHYDEVYDRKKNVINHQAKPILSVQNDTLQIRFAENDNVGELIFKRSSDGSLDKKLPFTTQNSIYKLPMTSFKEGNWQLEINWTSAKINYTHSQAVYLKR